MTMSQASRSVVAGFEVRENMGQSAAATTMAVLQAAGMPASTVIQWSGSVCAALAYDMFTYDSIGAGGHSSSELHIKARGRLDVTGTTDTAVGEVGASISFYGDFDNNNYFSTQSATVKMDYAWGWWKMTPELTFAGGYAGSLGTIGMGIRKVNDAYISRGTVGVDGGDFTQFRLSYASGPIGLAIAIEHTDEEGNNGNDGSSFGVAGEATYAGDMFNAEIAGYVRDADPNAINGRYGAFSAQTQSQIGLGIGAKLSDMFDVSVAGSIGNNVFYMDATGSTYMGDGWELSAAVVATLSDSISAELGAGMSSYDDIANINTTDRTAIAGGIYWSPVSQLKMGVQASWVNVDSDYGSTSGESTTTKAAFVTWWNF